MNKVLALAISATLATCAIAFADDTTNKKETNTVSSKGVTEGSLGFGTEFGSGTNKDSHAFTTVLEFRTFRDAQNGNRPLTFINMNSLYNVIGKSSYDKTSTGISLNGDIFLGYRFGAPGYGESSPKNATELYYGGNFGTSGKWTTNSPVHAQAYYDVGAETGLFVLRNNHVVTLSPTVTIGGIYATYRNPDGSLPKVAKSSEGGSAGLGGRTRWVYKDRLYFTAEYIHHPGGGPNSHSVDDAAGTSGVVWRRIYASARVRVTKNISVGGEFRSLRFDSVDGKPLKIYSPSFSITRIF